MPRKPSSKLSCVIKVATFKKKMKNWRKAAGFKRQIAECANNIQPANRTALIQAAENILHGTQAPRLPPTLAADRAALIKRIKEIAWTILNKKRLPIPPDLSKKDDEEQYDDVLQIAVEAEEA